MKPILLLIAAVLCIGCAAKREHWTQRPPTGPATERTVDEKGNPSFGTK
jgi:hypothetical protein